MICTAVITLWGSTCTVSIVTYCVIAFLIHKANYKGKTINICMWCMDDGSTGWKFFDQIKVFSYFIIYISYFLITIKWLVGLVT